MKSLDDIFPPGREPLMPNDPRHGRLFTYTNRGCRCKACTAVFEKRDPIRRGTAAVQTALARGELVRPERCEQCDKAAFCQAAHYDYSRLLDVRWLCQPCHVRWDKDVPKPTAIPA